MPESACRELCSLRNDCFGIDVFLSGNRCFLNIEGSAPDGCKSQYETANLGPISPSSSQFRTNFRQKNS